MILLTAVALLVSLASPTVADEGLLVESVTMDDGEITGYAGGPIGLEADRRAWAGSAYAVGAGGVRDAGVDIDFERRSADLDVGTMCRGTDGIGSLEVDDGVTSGSYEIALHDATIEFGEVVTHGLGGFGNGPFSLAGRWTDDAGNTGVFAGGGYFRPQGFEDHDDLGCPIDTGTMPRFWGEVTFVTDVGVIGDGGGSGQCKANGGPRIIDSTNQDVRTFVYVYQPTTDEVWVCARVEDTTTGEGYGGRLAATPGDAGLGGGSGTPTVDSASAACTTTTDPPNQVPTSHPISQGGVGPVDYMVDAYANDDEAWLCLQVGSSDHRVIVPLGGSSGTSFGTVATWHPDEGTPSL